MGKLLISSASLRQFIATGLVAYSVPARPLTEWLTALAKQLLMAIISIVLAFNYPGDYNVWKIFTCKRINNWPLQYINYDTPCKSFNCKHKEFMWLVRASGPWKSLIGKLFFTSIYQNISLLLMVIWNDTSWILMLLGAYSHKTDCFREHGHFVLWACE